MKLLHVPVTMYKKFFLILLCVFVGVFVLEFIASMLGNPLCETTVNDVVIIPETPLECLLNATVSALLIGGIVNVFLTIKIIKEKLGLSHWPAVIVVFMTVLFALEFLVGVLLLLPNIIIFGLKGRIKNRAYEVEF